MECPNCNCTNIQINEAWDKTIDLPRKYKIIYGIIAGVLILLTAGFFKVTFMAGIVSLILTVGFIGGGAQWYNSWKKDQKKKTHSKCICKHCGYIWYLD